MTTPIRPITRSAWIGPTACILAALASIPSYGQDPIRIDVVKSGIPIIKIAIPDPNHDGTDAEIAREIVETLRDDLNFSGYFEVVEPRLYSLVSTASKDKVPHEDWQSIGADSVGLIELNVQGQRIDLSAKVYDNAGPSLLLGRRYGGSSDLVRRIAHQIADDIVKQYTGREGVAMTRIAFVSEHENGKEVYLMDYDGNRIRRLTTTGTINLSPVWSPDGTELAYVSWRGRQPGVYVMSSEGKLGSLKTVGGELSSSPEWSPDGRTMVYGSDVSGNMELYNLDRTSGRNTQLTRHAAIDTSPAYSPTGREIAFTSDRTGNPQIYVMDAEGLNVRRISYTGNYNESAAWSPDGEKIAYVSRIDGRFQIMVLDLATERTVQVTSEPANHENPRWSPDGRQMVFASDRTGSYEIYTMAADGTRVRRLTRSGNCATPDWSR